ncbi:MAG: DUF5343 domain-containing protein [Pirellulales bacterium]|nr:DUF5343 domain-containing protein [Pirellulales bacterium]
MAMQPVYLVAINNLPKFLDALRHAQAPEKLTLRFVEELGFTSTNDRLFVPLLKAMKFIDDSGKPLLRYHSFLDDTQWKHVLAEGIKDAYSDLFRVNRQANTLSRDALTGKLKSLTEGKASPAVLKNTAKTFLELVKLADFSANGAPRDNETQPEPDQPEQGTQERPLTEESGSRAGAPTLVYRIEIVLPAVRDQAVYDAIFRSARQHLLR